MVHQDATKSGGMHLKAVHTELGLVAASFETFRNHSTDAEKGHFFLL